MRSDRTLTTGEKFLIGATGFFAGTALASKLELVFQTRNQAKAYDAITSEEKESTTKTEKCTKYGTCNLECDDQDLVKQVRKHFK